jgi:hypothetical protein
MPGRDLRLDACQLRSGPAMSAPTDVKSWHELADELSPKQVEWLTELESQNRPGVRATSYSAGSWPAPHRERLRVTAALETSGLEADCHDHHLRMAKTMIGVMGLQELTSSELVALNAILAPADRRFSGRGRRRRG